MTEAVQIVRVPKSEWNGHAGLDFVTDAEIPGATTIRLEPFEENNEQAVRVRDSEIRPRVERGESVILDFAGLRAPTQSFVHALLAPVFQLPGSLVRLSFLNCSSAAREVVRAVAAYASYRQIT